MTTPKPTKEAVMTIYPMYPEAARVEIDERLRAATAARRHALPRRAGRRLSRGWGRPERRAAR
jgi:hypothetical protein